MRGEAARSEQGYILIAAIWLLILAASIAALLMLHSMTTAQAARSEGDILRSRLALEAAVDTIVADRLMNGGRSIWSSAPADGTLDIEGLPVRVRATSEAQRVDLLRADPRLIDGRLRAAGLSPDEREAVIGRIASLGVSGAQPPSLALMDMLLGGHKGASGHQCLAEIFTPFPGGRLTEAGMSEPSPGGTTNPESLRGGDLQRLELRAPSGMSLTVVLRMTAQRDSPASIVDWQGSGLCSD